MKQLAPYAAPSTRRPSREDRILQLHKLLEARRRKGGDVAWTVPDLTAAINRHFAAPPFSSNQPFDGKTIRRDLDAMELQGLPVAWDEKRRSWSYTSPASLDQVKMKFMMSNQNAFTLLLARRSLSQFEATPLHDLLASVFDQMIAGLDLADRRMYESLLGRVRFSGAQRLPVPADAWGAIRDAMDGNYTLSMTYRTGQTGKVEKNRKVNPYALLILDREWHLLAFDHTHKKVLTFKVLRIADAEVGDDRFMFQKGFNLDAYLADTVFGYPTTGDKRRVKLRFTQAATPGGMETVWHPGQSKTLDAQGRLVVEFETSALFMAKKEVLSWGGGVEVLEPASLRAEVRAAALEAAGVHG